MPTSVTDVTKQLSVVTTAVIRGEGAPRKLATTTQPQFLRNVADFKQETGFQIRRHTLTKLMFD
jgi:hypothetical protein